MNFHLKARTIRLSLLHAPKESMNYCKLGNVLHMLHFLPIGNSLSTSPELLDSCLKSPLFPAYLAASFCKKLSRLSLAVPPSGALVIVALIHNLLRRHPSINCLVHQEGGSETTTDIKSAESSGADDSNNVSSPSRLKSSMKTGIDPFDDKQTDPLKTNAMRSSLWEVDTLRHHYCPPVSRQVYHMIIGSPVSAGIYGWFN
ncbi:Phosphate transporter 4,6 [Capsicum annuum]|nr:Phosphate transporter 4,6 [Capsicum annuum]